MFYKRSRCSCFKLVVSVTCFIAIFFLNWFLVVSVFGSQPSQLWVFVTEKNSQPNRSYQTQGPVQHFINSQTPAGAGEIQESRRPCLLFTNPSGRGSSFLLTFELECQCYDTEHSKVVYDVSLFEGSTLEWRMVELNRDAKCCTTSRRFQAGENKKTKVWTKTYCDARDKYLCLKILSCSYIQVFT